MRQDDYVGWIPEGKDQNAAHKVLTVFKEDGLIETDTPYVKSKLESEKRGPHVGYVPEPIVVRVCIIYLAGAKGNIQKRLSAVGQYRFPPLPEVRDRRSMVHMEGIDGIASVQGAVGNLAGPGITVPLVDPAALANGIRELLLVSLGEREKMRKRGLDFLEQHLVNDVFVPCYRALLARVVAGKSSCASL